MSASRRVISLFLIGHLAALALAAIPSPAELHAAAGAPESPDDALSSRVRPVLDASAGALFGLSNRIWQLTAFARPLAKRYAETLGLSQTWNMFANPPRGNEYLRFRYYWTGDRAGPGGPLTVATELVHPFAPEGESRLVRSYWQSHRDKAIGTGLDMYFRERTRRREAGLPPPSEHDPAFDDALARTFVPVVHYFSARFVRNHLLTDDRLVRTEAWHGWADLPPRGEARLFSQSHAAVLDRYAQGRPDEPLPQPRLQPLDSVEREADIRWTLIYIQTP